MTHDYPSVLPAVLPPPTAAKSLQPASSLMRVGHATSAVRYPGAPRGRLRLIIALLVAAGVHGGVLLGVRSHKAVVVQAEPEHLILMSIPIPDMKDLEEPDPKLDEAMEKPDLTDYAPTLADVPQIALPNSFVQEINFASLVPRPDLSDAKVFVIPNTIRTGRVGEGLANIFNLADLDRVPEPIVQPSPVFPPTLKREVSYAKVTVEFIVDTEGRVLNPVVVATTFPGFEEAAATGVSRWRFRAGMRGGRRVNTRMSVPIIFRIKEEN